MPPKQTHGQTFDTIWDGVGDNVRNQITVNGEAIVHEAIMEQVLSEHIRKCTGTEPDVPDYGLALAFFMKTFHLKLTTRDFATNRQFIFTNDARKY